ncbi:MAG: histidine kinase dimerization/phospho-acceptor domain-containing protein, partial [Sporomusa sp.]
MGIQCILIANYLLLVYATSKFFEKKLHPCWYYSGVVVAVLFIIATYFDWSLIAKTLPSILFVTSIYFWHGWMFIRYVDSKNWGKTVVGLSFIGMGVHTLDMPFLITVSWFAPWGFLISAILRFIISIGTLMLFVEKNLRDLIVKESQYRLLAENAADTIYLYRLKPSHGLEYISPSIGKLTGYHPNEYYQSPDLLFSLIHPSDSFWVESLVSNPADLTNTSLILRLIRRDHTVIWVEQTTVPIVDQNGVCISFEGIIRDITARKTLEQDVARLDRLNTVAQLAANVAHEIRNPLTTVRGYLQLFQKRPLFSNYREHFTLLIDELDRSNLIIKEYLSLCRNDPRDMQPCQLNDIIADLYPLIKATANGTSMDVV